MLIISIFIFSQVSELKVVVDRKDIPLAPTVQKAQKGEKGDRGEAGPRGQSGLDVSITTGIFQTYRDKNNPDGLHNLNIYQNVQSIRIILLEICFHVWLCIRVLEVFREREGSKGIKGTEDLWEQLGLQVEPLENEALMVLQEVLESRASQEYQGFLGELEKWERLEGQEKR